MPAQMPSTCAARRLLLRSLRREIVPGVHPNVDDQRLLIRALTDPAVYGSSCSGVRVIETHISYVLLTGRYAYKIKKAVALPFLDFTTLAARHFYCVRELELNRRLASAIYLDVVAIAATVAAPRIGGEGAPIEYAIKMIEFPQDALLPTVVARGELTPAHVDELAATVAAFHASVAAAPDGSRFGSASAILELAIENVTEIEPLLEHAADRRDLAALRRWTEREHAARIGLFAERQRLGFVRECHGDLHLGNIALVDGHVTIFDCIEFNEAMRWSDVMADIAFLTMDFQDRGRSDFAARFLNAYLELTGDYDGVPALRFYVVYRAMVRAKIACMRASQTDDPETRGAKIGEYRDYVAMARRCSESTARGIVITHGPTGSGKTTRTQALVELLGAVRIRTDVERKRLHGLTPQSHSGSALNEGLYSEAETERTYSHVARLTRTVVRAGYPVIVDGTFLSRRRREQFKALADELHVPFVIADFVASEQTLRRRVRERYTGGRDASEADISVLEHQLRNAEPLTPDEQRLRLTYDADVPVEQSRPVDSWRQIVDRLRDHALTGSRRYTS
jgi:aminoglycoside phosphotransferase family enzyme/predicted kinase